MVQAKREGAVIDGATERLEIHGESLSGGFSVRRANSTLYAIDRVVRGEVRVRGRGIDARILEALEPGTRTRLVRDDEILATMRRAVDLPPTDEIDSPDDTWELLRNGTVGRKVTIRRRGKVVGIVDPDRLDTRAIIADLPETWGRELGALGVFTALRLIERI